MWCVGGEGTPHPEGQQTSVPNDSWHGGEGRSNVALSGFANNGNDLEIFLNVKSTIQTHTCNCK